MGIVPPLGCSVVISFTSVGDGKFPLFSAGEILGFFLVFLVRFPSRLGVVVGSLVDLFTDTDLIFPILVKYAFLWLIFRKEWVFRVFLWLIIVFVIIAKFGCF